mgnify:CR=1 FL=1|jgi:DNA-binding transcriptional regulator YiaG
MRSLMTEVRELLENTTMSLPDIADFLGVSTETVYSIRAFQEETV